MVFKLSKLILVLALLCTSLSFSQETGKNFILSLFQENNIDKGHQFFDESVKREIATADLEKVVETIKSQFGDFVKIMDINNEGNVYYYYTEFKHNKIDIQISLTANNKINGFFLKQHKVFNKAGSLGQILNVKSGDINIQGTLLVPEANNSKKLVIMVAGSGPQDRDETTADNKPFKDIAEGLYAKGIASYRFDKRTYSNPDTFSDKSTIDYEYTNDVVTLINYFRANYPEYEITLLGHSLGGYILPKIANKAPGVSKLVIMAANARQLDEVVAEQLEYLKEVNPSPELTAEAEKFKERQKFLNSKSFNADSPKEKLPFGLSAAYWKSLKNYHVEKEAKKLDVPVLVLQGERDYQVTMTDFELWKKLLKANKKTTFKSYPKLNHLFMSGEGKATPQEYLTKSSVSDEVIQDITSFVKQ